MRPSAHAFGRSRPHREARRVRLRAFLGKRTRISERHPAGHQPRRLRDPGDLLRRRARDRVRREALHQDEPRLLPLRPLAAGLDHRTGLHLGQPRRAGDPGHGRQRRAVRRLHRPLLLDRRDPGHGLPRPGDDALLLRLEGPQRARVPAAALQPADARLQRAVLRRGDRADRRREPLRARAGAGAAAGLADPPRHRRGRGDRARLHHARRPQLGDLQRGAPVLRDPRRADPADDRRADRRRRLGRPQAVDRRDEGRRQAAAVVGGHRRRQRGQPAGRLVDPDRLRPRVRALVRLLDDELRRGPARAVGQEPRRGPAHAADRRLPEAVHPGRDDHPRPRRAGDDPRPRRRRRRTWSTTTRSRC